LIAWAGLRAAGPDFLYTQPLAVSEYGEITDYVLVNESRKINFLPPPGWSVGYEPTNQTVTLLAPDLSAGISFKTVLRTNRDEVRPTPEQVRREVQQRFPKAVLAEEFEYPSRVGTGVAFDLEETVGPDVRASFRVVVIEAPVGRLDLELRALPDRFNAQQKVLRAFLASLRLEAVSAKTSIASSR
jgi:hypothetical protein